MLGSGFLVLVNIDKESFGQTKTLLFPPSGSPWEVSKNFTVILEGSSNVQIRFRQAGRFLQKRNFHLIAAIHCGMLLYPKTLFF